MNNTSCYCLQVSDKYQSQEEVFKVRKNIFQLMRRIKLKDEKYKDISYLIGVSNTTCNSASITFIRNGKKGRPKKVVNGDKVLWHLHIYAITKDKYLSAYCNQICSSLRKRGYRVKMFKHNNMQVAIDYTKKQSLSVWNYGDYFQSQTNN